jgi:hypothetical protein
VKLPASVVDVGCTTISLVFHITGSRPDANCSSPAAWVTLGPDTLYGCIHAYAPRNLDTFQPSIDGLPRQPYKHYCIEALYVSSKRLCLTSGSSFFTGYLFRIAWHG